MSEGEKVLDDFPMKDSISPAEFMVGGYRAEYTKDWSFTSGITPKIPPSYDGTTSWFKYEELRIGLMSQSSIRANKVRRWRTGFMETPTSTEDSSTETPSRLKTELSTSWTCWDPILLKGAYSVFLRSFTDSWKERETLKWSTGLENLTCCWNAPRILGWTCYLCHSPGS